MTGRLLIFGLGYTATRLAASLVATGWQVSGTRRDPAGGAAVPQGVEVLAYDDNRVGAMLARATHILSSVPPAGDSAPFDPVLADHGAALERCPALWIGYLSSTGVYGDTGGAWVDEEALIGSGRRQQRSAADLGWQTLATRAAAPLHIFRLPGIYGPGRSALDRVRTGQARRLALTGAIANHVVSRVHVDDIIQAVGASMSRPSSAGGARIYNIADDEPAASNAVVEYACDLLGLAYPPLEDYAQAQMSNTARGFYAECRRIMNVRMKEELGVRLLYPTYREGLRACLEEEQAA